MGQIRRANSSGAVYTFQLWVTSINSVQFDVGDGTNVYELNSNSQLSVGVWYHIAGVWDGTNQIIYIDGVQDALANIGSKTLYTNPSDPVQIGFINSGCAIYQFAGLIDEVQIFHVALTAVQVAAIYDAGSSGVCPPAWKPSRHYFRGDEVHDPAKHVQMVITAGRSGTTRPTWNDAGGKTTDGTVVWQDKGLEP